ncbi:MAG TPA: TRAP transporter large permease subunit [Stellaceae bacterium]|jgi:tripartite ATP-independent transporter DctM subunit
MEEPLIHSAATVAAPIRGTDYLDLVQQFAIVAARRIASLGVIIVLLIALGTLLGVLSRWLFNRPITGYDEIVEMGIAAAVAATFPFCAASRGNLAIDILTQRLGPRRAARCELFGAFALLLFYGLLAWQLGVYARDLNAQGQTTIYLAWPIAPFIWIVAVFLGLAAAAQAIVCTVDVRNMARAAAHHPTAALSVALPVIGAFVVALAITGILAYAVSALAPVAQDSPRTLAVLLFLVMWGLSLALVPVAAAMGLVGVAGAVLLTGFGPALNVLATTASGYLTDVDLSVLPLFLIMGSFATRAGLSSDIYELAHVLLSHLRGGLALATIGGCAGFGALTGSSVATAATVGNVALPEMRARGYSPGLATGCVAAGGTLGQLVPPSTPIILYAILTEQSIGQLFIAAVIPATITVALYMATIMIYVRLVPDAAPAAHQRAKLDEIIRAIRKAWGVLLLFALIIGGLYGGIFTVNEAAAVGAMGTFLFALFRGKLGGGALWNVMAEVTRTTAMIYLLIFGAVTFSFFAGISGLPDLLGLVATGLHLGPLGVIAVILFIYVFLGCIMDSFSVMVITIPIVTPLITNMGYDLIWWGIINVFVIETGLITPPFGMNVFILKGIQGGDVPMWTAFRGVLPFVAADVVMLAMLVLFPVLSLWLPSTMVH